MATGDSMGYWEAPAAHPGSTATFDNRNSVPVLEFDKDTDEFAVFGGVLPRQYSGNGLTVEVMFFGDGITTGNVRWDVQFERGTTDIDSDSFATAVSATTATNGTDGISATSSIALTNAQIDGLLAGEPFRIKVNRDANNAADTAAADAQVHKISMYET